MVACATEGPVPKSNDTMQAAPSKPAADAGLLPGLKDLAFSIKFIRIHLQKVHLKIQGNGFMYRFSTISDSDYHSQFFRNGSPPLDHNSETLTLFY